MKLKNSIDKTILRREFRKMRRNISQSAKDFDYEQSRADRGLRFKIRKRKITQKNIK